MVNRRIVVTGLTAVAFTPLLGNAASAADDVKVGVLMPLSGQLANYGAKLRTHAEFAAEQINAAGGIKELDGAKIRLVFADTRGVPEAGQAEAERLILREQVDILMGAYNSSVTMPATVVAERYKKPFVVFSSVAEEITDRGLKYTFRANETSGGIVDTIFGLLDQQVASTGKNPESYATVFENTDFGRDIALKFGEKAAERGWREAAAVSYEQGLSDGTPIALTIGSAKPDILATFTVHPDGVLLYRAMKEQAVRPPLAIDYANSMQTEFDPVLADFPGLFVVSSWDSSITMSRPFLAPVVEAYQKAYGELPLPDGLQAFSNVYLIADALARAGSREADKVRDALAATNLDTSSASPALILPYEKISFDEKGQNPGAGLMILQSFEGKRIPIYPPSVLAKDYEIRWY